MISLFIACIFHALASAKDDVRQIEGHEPVNHAMQWAIRCSIAVGVALVCAAFMYWPWHKLLAGGIAYAFLFSAVFRWHLNYLRGKPADYVSLSNRYDAAFIMAFGVDAGRAAYFTELTITAACVAAFYLI